MPIASSQQLVTQAKPAVKLRPNSSIRPWKELLAKGEDLESTPIGQAPGILYVLKCVTACMVMTSMRPQSMKLALQTVKFDKGDFEWRIGA